MIFSLPFDTKPYSTMYHYTAFPLGIVMGNAAHEGIDIEPWLSSKYIHCFFDDSSLLNKFDLTYSAIDNWAIEEKVLIKSLAKVDHGEVEGSNCDIIDFLRNSLKTGHYLYGPYNEQMIPQKEAYNKRYYLHDYILYGYDDEQKCFLSAGYISNGKYQAFTIPYANMKAALLSCQYEIFHIDLLSFNRNAEFCFNVEKLKRGD